MRGPTMYVRAMGSGGETAATAGVTPVTPIPRRRRLPSPEEQARRQAWGKKWGYLVAEAVRQSLGSR